MLNAKTTEKQTEVRQPVVAIVGHVDHGKSTLLDYIRKTNVAEKEAGGITQRIGAYEVLHKTTEGKERRLSFIDTPGHEAFGGSRGRAVGAADVAILAVASDEGAKPQTLESIKILQKHNIPFVVAFTKADKPNADAERAKQSLAEHELYVEGYGGAVPSAGVSAKTGAGVSELLDLVLLLADMHGAPCDSTQTAKGVVIEAERGSAKGISATLVVKNGTVRKGQALVAGKALSIIRTLEDYSGKPIAEAGCGRIARVGGWSELPSAGDAFRAYENKKEAEKSLKIHTASGERNPKKSEKQNEVNATRVVVPLVVKADTAGSIEAIKHELAKLQSEKIEMKIIGAGLGDIGEGDLRLAGSACDAVLVGFNVGADSAAERHAKATGTKIHLFDIIYRLSDFITEIAKARTPKEKREEVAGQARIVKIFSEEKSTQVVGGKVLEGVLALGDEFRIVRRGERIGTGRTKELQKFKEKIREAAVGTEFGALTASTFPLAVGDTIEVVRIVEI
ncbi:MAG: translation initiation factor IF-2 [Parcubacteria group bacterium Gr01-1014_17]|nr:MAG: translation initiation factor IF-2 [Parcubacteria group bacterium Gr01-1014_17]